MITPAYRILDQRRVGSSWKGDEIGKRYHFPKKYLKLLKAPGLRFIYHEPKTKGGWEFFGCGEIGKIIPDPKNNGQFFAEITGYRPFITPVPALDKRGVLREAKPFFNKQNAVRRVAPEVFKAICAEGGIPDVAITQIGSSSSPALFTKADALDGLFMTELELEIILARLKRKKALILQGPPGVGKTFIARRLAFALMKERAENRVKMVQFHPSYGYEDFIQGYRPIRNGSLERRDGVFFQFVTSARNEPTKDWFFIIDEINRGNLAKIFGELLMFIEADKRGPAYAIPLTYSENPDETFYLPANLYLIGTMNTADRSLAMVDYALRRRFAFVTLDPKLDSPTFADWLKKRNASDALIARIRSKIINLNAEIEKERDLGPGFRIGHSFFCPPDGQLPDETWYREVIEGEIQPLMEEYFDSRERGEKLVAELLAE